MLEKRGMKRVCAKCGAEGHMVAGCKTPWCLQCAIFGHATEDCHEKCRKCQGDHATVNCTLPPSYATAVYPPDETPPPENSEAAAAAATDLSPRVDLTSNKEENPSHTELHHDTASHTEEPPSSGALPTPGQRTPHQPKALQQHTPGLKNPINQVADLLPLAYEAAEVRFSQEDSSGNGMRAGPSNKLSGPDENKRAPTTTDSTSPRSSKKTSKKKKRLPGELEKQMEIVSSTDSEY